MRAAEVFETLRSGKSVFGAQIISTTPMVMPFLEKMDLDIIFLDLEHIPMDREITSWMCRAFTAAGIMPFMRVPKPEASLICQYLDAGAEGIIVPYIERAEQLRELVGAVRYRPLKGKYLELLLDGNYELNDETKEFLDGNVWNCNPKDKMLLINIESRPGMENLDEILSVPGIDGVMIGPQDLSISLGVPERYDSPKFDAAVKEIAEKTRAHGLYCGIHFAETVEQAVHFIQDYGIQIYLESNELVAFVRDVGERVNKIKRGIL